MPGTHTDLDFGPRTKGRGRGGFVTTNWSLVVAACVEGEQREESLGELCELYWFPLYAYLRRQGSSRHDAEDLVQSFLAWLIDSDVLKRADRQRGRFRTFLRVSIRQFCARQGRRARAQKRSPRSALLSLDFASAESRYDASLADHWTPDRVFDHAWALTTLEVAAARLREEYHYTDRLDRFEYLAPFLSGGKEADRVRAAEAMGLSMAAFNMALGRLRRQFGKRVREEVARTVEAAHDIDDELREMTSALAPV